jgi:hypothetical protein
MARTVVRAMRIFYRVSENFMLKPKSRVVVGYELEESNGVLVWRS